MTPLVLIFALAAASAATSDRLPPASAPPPQVRDLPGAEPPPTIFLYTVDERCRIGETRKLQGPPEHDWADAEAHHELYDETTVWRFFDGVRRQLKERRVKLKGEMVREGALVCLVLPSGEVVDAWVERQDASAGRRRTPTREPVTVRGGEIEELGTFSLELVETDVQRSAS